MLPTQRPSKRPPQRSWREKSRPDLPPLPDPQTHFEFGVLEDIGDHRVRVFGAVAALAALAALTARPEVDDIQKRSRRLPEPRQTRHPRHPRQTRQTRQPRHVLGVFLHKTRRKKRWFATATGGPPAVQLRRSDGVTGASCARSCARNRSDAGHYGPPGMRRRSI